MKSETKTGHTFLEDRIDIYEKRIQDCQLQFKSYEFAILLLMKGKVAAKQEAKKLKKEIKKLKKEIKF